MGIRLKIILSVLILAIIPSIVMAGWQGPETVVSGGWGSAPGAFGLAEYDMDYTLPNISAVVPTGEILIHDILNRKMMVFTPSGELIKEVLWETVIDPSGKRINLIPEYWVYGVKRFTIDGNVVAKVKNGGNLLSPKGDILASFDEKSFEVGIVSIEKNVSNQFVTNIQFEDYLYTVYSSGLIKDYVRDRNDYLYVTTKYYIDKDKRTWTIRVIKLDRCGNVLGNWDKPFGDLVDISSELNSPPPPTAQFEILEEFGSPVIGPDGSIYAWKRTPNTYSILKWEWADDPSDTQGGPEPPSQLAVQASLDGLLVTWGASPQDPGCVDSYEVERATSSDGIYSSIGSTNAGTLRYNDTTILPGETVYYKVRAKSGGEYSDYTAVDSGKRF